MSNKAPFVAALLFGMGALIHLARLVCPFDVVIAGHYFPYWASAAIFLLGGMLSAWLLRGRET